MKFFWKIFFVFTALITMVFSIFGIFLITQSFRNSMNKEIEECDRENRMYQYAFEMNMNSISANYRTDRMVGALAESLTGNLDVQNYTYKLYRDGRRLLYQSSEEYLQHGLLEKMADNDCMYQVMEQDGRRYLIFVCKSEIGGRNYYLESAKDITDVYEERDDFYSQYRVIMLGLILMIGIVVYVVSRFLTRSVAGLSYTTKRFAKGDYEVRAKVYSDDEIGVLAQDFNGMADNLTQKMDELREQARRQEDFTASFAHELKTPLTSIIGYADMLRTMDMEKHETMEAANYIYSQGKRLESLSFKLLELIVADKQDYQFKPVAVEELVPEVVQMAQEGLKQKEITCTISVENGVILGEKDLLTSMLLNMIDNARKALSKNGQIQILGENTEDGYELSVRDNGCGMPQSEIHKITEAFYMVDKSRSRKEGGAGLGMTLCNKIIALHKATWYIESTEGEGTVIRVLFPKRKEVSDEADA